MLRASYSPPPQTHTPIHLPCCNSLGIPSLKYFRPCTVDDCSLSLPDQTDVVDQIRYLAFVFLRCVLFTLDSEQMRVPVITEYRVYLSCLIVRLYFTVTAFLSNLSCDTVMLFAFVIRATVAHTYLSTFLTLFPVCALIRQFSKLWYLSASAYLYFSLKVNTC